MTEGDCLIKVAIVFTMICIVLSVGNIIMNEQRSQICSVCEKSNFTAYICYPDSEIEVYCDQWKGFCLKEKTNERE